MRFAALVVLVLISATHATAADLNWGSARWIWDAPNANEGSQENEPRFFRKVFELAEKPAEAKLSISCDNEYVVYVNGQKVGEDSSWNEAETYDVAKLLVAGKNCLAIRATNQGGPAGVIAMLRVKVGGKESLAVATDATWKGSLLELAGWMKAEYDEAAAKAKWGPVNALGDATIGPWNIAGASSGPTTGGGTNISSYRPASEELTHFTVPEGYKIELVASEPLIINPVAIALDDEGRLYVSESHSYRFGPSGSPLKPISTNPIVRLDRGPDGKLTRTLVAEGFDDPVMGMLIRGNQLFATANNYLWRFDLDKDGKGTNKTKLLEDKNKAWNPFGMFVLEDGLDGMIYLSVGDHKIDIEGPNGKVTGRGNSGIVCRFNPDGTNLERLVHGLRVPYSFDVDPYGQMWLLSNGEGNPNRFLRVLEGVDYHCFTRSVDYDWLAGRHPLAPPCFELPRGAHTQLMRYYGSNFAPEMNGSLLLDNWGAHGFNGGNRSIFRYVPDERNNITTKEAFISCSDPHFRCSHILLAPDGSLLIADWYGRDDESDMTGRIWRVSGSGQPEPPYSLDADGWKSIPGYAHAALGAPNHLIRKKAMDTLVARGNEAVKGISDRLRNKKEPFAAAHALWTLYRIGTPEAREALALGGIHDDWRVRRLALNLLRRIDPAAATALAEKLAADPDPAVRVAAGIAQENPAKAIATLLGALEHGAADDEHLRYEAAWHIAKHATDDAPFAKLVAAKEDNVRLAGFIAIDIALYEDFAGAKEAARKTLIGLLSDPQRVDFEMPLMLAQLNLKPELAPALEGLAKRGDVQPAVVAKSILLLRTVAGTNKTLLDPAIAKVFLAAIDQGAVKLNSPNDQLTHLDLLDAEGPTERALNFLARYGVQGSPEVKRVAIARLRKFGPPASAVAPILWQRLFASGANEREERLQLVGALSEIEKEPNRANWERLLSDKDMAVRIDAVRTWRAFKGKPEMVELLKAASPTLVELVPAVKGDLEFVQRSFDPSTKPAEALDAAGRDKLYAEMLGVLADATKLTSQEQQQMAHLGKRVFERTGCTKCHTTATADTPLAPSLRNVGQGLKHEGLVEAILFPSKVIKTGFLPETITTVDGKVVTGLVKDDGQQLRVLTADKETIVPKADVERRDLQKLSIMPEGQEQLFTRDEFRDLLVYLLSLK